MPRPDPAPLLSVASCTCSITTALVTCVLGLQLRAGPSCRRRARPFKSIALSRPAHPGSAHPPWQQLAAAAGAGGGARLRGACGAQDAVVASGSSHAPRAPRSTSRCRGATGRLYGCPPGLLASDGRSRMADGQLLSAQKLGPTPRLQRRSARRRLALERARPSAGGRSCRRTSICPSVASTSPCSA